MRDKPLGWYAEPGDPTLERLWSGTEWTTSTRAAEPAPPAEVTSAPVKVPAIRARFLAPLGAVVLVLLVLGAVKLSHHPTYTITGSMVVHQIVDGAPGDPCETSGGYSDVSTGAEVTVYDQNGKVIATSTLDDGVTTSARLCRFHLEVDDVPDAHFYKVEVAHRGTVQFSKDDMVASGWQVELTLGS